MKLWLDDERKPRGLFLGAAWAKTADQAIALLQAGDITAASLDYCLHIDHALGEPTAVKSGLDVLLWMEQNHVWPRDGVRAHSGDPEACARMQQIIDRQPRAADGEGDE